MGFVVHLTCEVGTEAGEVVGFEAQAFPATSHDVRRVVETWCDIDRWDELPSLDRHPVVPSSIRANVYAIDEETRALAEVGEFANAQAYRDYSKVYVGSRHRPESYDLLTDAQELVASEIYRARDYPERRCHTCRGEAYLIVNGDDALGDDEGFAVPCVSCEATGVEESRKDMRW